MKNTRKAAAVWLAMSLAISTAFGIQHGERFGRIQGITGVSMCIRQSATKMQTKQQLHPRSEGSLRNVPTFAA